MPLAPSWLLLILTPDPNIAIRCLTVLSNTRNCFRVNILHGLYLEIGGMYIMWNSFSSLIGFHYWQRKQGESKLYVFCWCLNHDTQKWMNHKMQEWESSYIVVSSWFQNKDIPWPMWLHDLTLFNPETLVTYVIFFYI